LHADLDHCVAGRAVVEIIEAFVEIIAGNVFAQNLNDGGADEPKPKPHWLTLDIGHPQMRQKRRHIDRVEMLATRQPSYRMDGTPVFIDLPNAWIAVFWKTKNHSRLNGMFQSFDPARFNRVDSRVKDFLNNL
jgi:hypothetical protein